MDNLSEDHRKIIAKYPLGTSLEHTLEALRKAEQSNEPGSLSYVDTLDSPSSTQKAISRLLSTLLGHEVAFNLRSKARSENIASELSSIIRRVQSGNFNYEHYRALSKLVIKQASDVEIWNAVFDLISIASPITPPASVPTSFNDTPITHSSASQQGAEQAEDLLKERLFEEIKTCTYRSADGFVQKHFEGKEWTPCALEIYKTKKRQHRNGRWTDFPDPPVQDSVTEWWFRFQDEFLSKERRRYYKTSSPKDLKGAEARRQLDLFVKRNDGPTPETVHDLRDVTMIGELKESNADRKGTLLQISRYVRDIFACQPTRRYVPAFTLCSDEMEIWIFDRSGPYGPGPFNIHEEPERFIKVISGYTMMDDKELGVDTFTEVDVDGRFITLPQHGIEPATKVRLDPSPFVFRRAIVCQGTSCFLSKTPASESYDCVVKFSWTSDRRQPEAELLKLARQRGVKGVASLVGSCRITSVAEMRSGLAFGKPYPFRSQPSVAPSFSPSFSQYQTPNSPSGSFSELHGLRVADGPSNKRKLVDIGQRPSKRLKFNSRRSSQQQNEVTYDVEEAQGTSLTATHNEPYDDRIFRCLVISPAGRAIRRPESPLELLEALRDAIKAHRSLYLEGNILHRDISENNIIITKPETDGFKGMLIDLDLAKELGGGRSGARCRTGTMEFMAIEVLDGISHTYRHDLESFFYVLLWLCGRRGWEFVGRVNNQPERSVLNMWYSGSYRDIASAKRGHMDSGGIEYILQEFPQPELDCVRPLCRELRAILFPFRHGLFIGTPKDPELLYGPIIRAYDTAIDDIKAAEG
ncbi:MAG: hypothetical protein M1825_001219 [Sarcosagium campestre]|nr:MAG: hypothetical protein M1825_001219 [Sarcosagium campestre]